MVSKKEDFMLLEIMNHCGNAPKMERVIELTIALAKKDINLIYPHVSKDFIWRIVGSDKETKLYELVQEFTNITTITKLTIENALSHGNGAMCEGTVTFEGGNVFYFCNVVKYTSTTKNASVQELHTYYIENKVY